MIRGEISSGNESKEKYPLYLSEFLTDKLTYEISGKFSEIYFTASCTKTINTNKWLGIHIELPSELRIEGGNLYPPSRGYEFCEVLADGIEKLRDYLRNF